MKIGMSELSPYQVAAIRMLSSGLVLLPFTVSAIRQIPKDKIGMVILSGLLGSFFPAFLFCIAETKIDSSLAGILNALTPLFTILLGALVFNVRASSNKYIGVAIGFVGLCLLFLAKANIDFSYFSFSTLVILATFFYGVNVNLVGKHMLGVGSLNIAAVAFTFLIIPSASILAFTGFFSYNFSDSNLLIATAASVVLGVFGTAAASVLFYVLVKRAGGLFASTVTYGIPFVAVFWGLLNGEHINILQVLCLGIILVGVYMAHRL
jgi:drug/metabolite transporter (DMT)-like permease